MVDRDEVPGLEPRETRGTRLMRTISAVRFQARCPF